MTARHGEVFHSLGSIAASVRVGEFQRQSPVRSGRMFPAGFRFDVITLGAVPGIGSTSMALAPCVTYTGLAHFPGMRSAMLYKIIETSRSSHRHRVARTGINCPPCEDDECMIRLV